MYELFKSKASAVGAEVHRVAGKKEAFGFITSLLKEECAAELPGCRAIWAEGPFLEGIDRETLRNLPGLSFEVTRERAAQAKVGISEMSFAVADTGSLVQDQSAPADRLASSLTDIHIALVPSTNIVPDKASLFTRISPKTSRYIAFITGPSRTADIERVLTIGVHGPQRLVILFVDELEGGRR
ncbi:yvbY protein [Geoanaerobacter pelophilus]|uniref:YvbY protein n=1 Tax=Geoanaerobacter pelophilus TaxID=60036 RepID=A0ABQ0MIS8_9BACT|nr:lactate utilization protein [Geoanaerobacter pelophilus]GAW66990.1 yvbY protein [Geoanaerobacter pelophilus]